MENDSELWDPDNWADEDFVEELLRRNGHYTDSQIRTEISRLTSEKGGQMQALEHAEQRVDSAVRGILDRIKSDAQTYALLVAVRDELVEQTGEDGPGDEEDDSDEDSDQD